MEPLALDYAVYQAWTDLWKEHLSLGSAAIRSRWANDFSDAVEHYMQRDFDTALDLPAGCSVIPTS